MQNIIKTLLILLLVFVFACQKKDDAAKHRLDAARAYYQSEDYQKAKQEIDSLNILYPKALEERKAALAFLDTLRRAENAQIVADCDSLIQLLEPQIASAKTSFTYQKNKEYQEQGAYIPKESYAGGAITFTTLRSGVKDGGVFYIESVFVGGGKHNRIKVTAKDGASAQSGIVTGDGLNYRFSNMGKSYEIIHFTGEGENGVGQFIDENKDKPLTVTLEGGQKSSYTLSQSVKAAISRSYRLSRKMLQLDSLKMEKEKAEYRNFYLDNKKEGKTDAIIE
ncbi:hypothetical protein [Dysgonomonas sp. 511]|uniref:hypothetical protein n=1 Tax=Dysgonomonas sp. 511 TaxID=2302930 RepID=UPI0013D07294|nr:hypothetical protein [Dysgonomonas sp. 511]NDV79038.1 hypothetical protein [Dysgonomonas sp. 511]